MKKIWIIGIVILILILGIWYFGFFRFDNTVIKNCVKEGGKIGAQGMPPVCCSGLTPVSGWGGGYQGNCSILAPPTGLSTCSNCGNKICDINNEENKCNCAIDCDNPNNYVCPESINCMPLYSKEKGEYCNWIIHNCKNITDISL